ncbi:substrate-binding domain-containing protein [Streptomyces sp. GC420]|uniref:substrate-binding domain-containing protein n=1 Tax=Streptomyces sp. GC420 TaxID=2697568 RepID=UPI001414D9DF|nr:substrate-binding domain-containing protein [Streptomyces sp. GC420]NBM18696.1 solute-binding protein [Streptomyces sp. GC420]
MDWVNADIVVAVFSSLLGLAATAATIWYRPRAPRKRIGYRVQMDTPIGSDNRDGQDRTNVRLGLFDELADMSDATLVLLRVENDGAESIRNSDYTSPDPDHGLTVTFSGRTVRGVAVTQPDAQHLMEHFTPDGSAGLQHAGNRIQLPRVPLNPDQHYKLLVLLTGGPVGAAVTVTGGLQDGVVVPNRSMSVDEKPPLFSRPARYLTAALTSVVILLAGFVVVREELPPPIGCASGELTVIGSTAFAAVAEELAEEYESDCPGSRITVDAHGSDNGIRDLDDGKGSPAPALVAVSDGRKPDGYPKLVEERVAVSVFAVVVNEYVPVKDLTTEQLRRIYRGEITNWNEVGGPDLDIRLVSRDANSGTRDTFRRQVLAGRGEPAFSSRDCLRKDDPSARVIRCELNSTAQVLRTVARVRGAIGYSELRATSGREGLHTVRLNGAAPSVQSLAEGGGPGAYPFTEVEYAYTRGRPAAGSIRASFLNYMIRGAGQDIMTAHGHLPCYHPEGMELCTRR